MSFRRCSEIYRASVHTVVGERRPDQLRLGLFTGMVPAKWDVEANWQAFEATFVAHIKHNKIDLVVTPECFLDGYAAEAQDWSLERFSRIAQDITSSLT